MGQCKDNVDLDVSLLDVNSEPTGHNHVVQPDNLGGGQLDVTPNQAASMHSDVMSASNRTTVHHIESLQLDSISNPNSATELVSHQVVGSPSGNNHALVMSPSQYSSLSGWYMHSNQKLLFLLLTVVALIAILIKLAHKTSLGHSYSLIGIIIMRTSGKISYP